jgi:hypothetical protein
MGDDSHVAFGKKLPGEERYVVVIQQFFCRQSSGLKSSQIFTQSPSDVSLVCGMTVWPDRLNSV